MGVAGSHLTRYIRRFNVIDRTERILDKEKPIPAPLHKADAERFKNFQDDPQFKEEKANRNSVLEKNLHSVYVKSEGDMPDVYPQSRSKLPKNREQIFNTGFMTEEPEVVPLGRFTLTQIIECIADHNKDKQIYTAKVLADRVKIDEKVMEDILKYYRIFDVHIPPKMMEAESKNKNFISSAIDKIRLSLEVDKYKEEQKQVEEEFRKRIEKQ